MQTAELKLRLQKYTKMSDMTEAIKDLSFEEALRALEETVTKLEEGELTLDDTLVLFERGQHLAAHCQQYLENASLRVEQLTADGEIVESDI